MADKMYTRGLTSHVNAIDGSNHQVMNLANLHGFEGDTVRNINDLMEHTNHLHRRINAITESMEFLNWIQAVHPHLVNDYKTSERVAARLTEDDRQEEVMCEREA